MACIFKLIMIGDLKSIYILYFKNITGNLGIGKEHYLSILPLKQIFIYQINSKFLPIASNSHSKFQ